MTEQSVFGSLMVVELAEVGAVLIEDQGDPD